MDVGRGVEDQRLATDLELLSIGDHVDVLVAVQALGLRGGQLRAIDQDVGIAGEEGRQGAGMVRLHVVQHQDVEVLKLQSKLGEVVIEGGTRLDIVYQDLLVASDNTVGVDGNALVYWPATFEKVVMVLLVAEEMYIVCDCAKHGSEYIAKDTVWQQWKSAAQSVTLDSCFSQ